LDERECFSVCTTNPKPGFEGAPEVPKECDLARLRGTGEAEDDGVTTE